MIRSATTIALSSIALWSVAHGAADWRVEFLKSKGISNTRESLQKAAAQTKVHAKEIGQAFQQLGALSYQQREKAQKQLISLGTPVIDYLKSKQPIESPEIRKRTEEILQHLESNVNSPENLIVTAAAKSLLTSPDDKSTGGQFFEWFGTEAADCRNGYRQWTYEGAKDVGPFVQKGQLFIPGKCQGSVDQRMVLRATAWPATKELPKHFTVTCTVAGTDGGNGVWHLGITIGKVKTLIHPGYRGGAFRYEQVGTLHKFTENISMGYTPATNQLHRMKITVKQLENGRVQLNTTISSPDHKSFEKSIAVSKDDIGPLNQISLDRSGNIGGNAYFDDFRVLLEP